MPPATEFPEWLQAPWRAWHHLATERPHTVTGISVPMGGVILKSQPGPIPRSALEQWCDRAEVGSDEREFICHVVDRMDREFLDWWQEHHGKN